MQTKHTSAAARSLDGKLPGRTAYETMKRTGTAHERLGPPCYDFLPGCVSKRPQRPKTLAAPTAPSPSSTPRGPPTCRQNTDAPPRDLWTESYRPAGQTAHATMETNRNRARTPGPALLRAPLRFPQAPLRLPRPPAVCHPHHVAERPWGTRIGGGRDSSRGTSRAVPAAPVVAPVMLPRARSKRVRHRLSQGALGESDAPIKIIWENRVANLRTGWPAASFEFSVNCVLVKLNSPQTHESEA